MLYTAYYTINTYYYEYKFCVRVSLQLVELSNK